MLAAQLGEGVTDDVVKAAEVVEITHLASLYHDDVMDDAKLRRGVPAVHEVWGNSVAILAGDLLFARAGAVGASLGSEFATIHATTFERMCLGQLHESIGARGADPVEHYIRVLADKTGSLIASAAELGALVSGADAVYRQPLRDFGERIGVAFQLVDDVLDLSDSPETGKLAGTDLRAGVITLPLLRLRAAADVDAARRHRARGRRLPRRGAEAARAPRDARHARGGRAVAGWSARRAHRTAGRAGARGPRGVRGLARHPHPLVARVRA
jgi:heptaprenyl diphosphate synthase